MKSPPLFVYLSVPSTLIALLLSCTNLYAQATASIEGQVVDEGTAVIAGVEIRASSHSIGVDRLAVTDSSGRYQIFGLPVGNYRLEVRARGFSSQVVETVRVEVGRIITQN